MIESKHSLNYASQSKQVTVPKFQYFTCDTCMLDCISFSSILTRPPVVLACMCMLDHEEAWKNVWEQRIIHGKLNYILVQVRCLLSWWSSSSWMVSSRPCNVVPTTALFLNRQLGINKESNISRCLSILISQIWKQPKFFHNNCSWLRWSSSSGHKIRCPLSSLFPCSTWIERLILAIQEQFGCDFFSIFLWYQRQCKLARRNYRYINLYRMLYIYIYIKSFNDFDIFISRL
jgi:hypothetical protein